MPSLAVSLQSRAKRSGKIWYMTLRRNQAGVSKPRSYTVRRKPSPRELMSWPKRPPCPAQSQYSPPARPSRKTYHSAAASSGIVTRTNQRPFSSAISQRLSNPSP